MSNDRNIWETLTEKDYCDPSKRMDFILLFDVKNGNPNGDPDAGNLPRMDPTTGHGIVTDVCIKRKVRDYMSGVLGRKIYIQNQESLNSLYFKAAQQIADNVQENASSANRGQEEEDRTAIVALYVSLDKSNEKFANLIKEPEENSGPEISESENEMTFRSWLDDIDEHVEGMQFDLQSGVLSYIGEAKTKNEFQDLLKGKESELAFFEKQISELANLLATTKKTKKRGAKEREGRDAVKRKMCSSYDDIRLFGAVLTAGTNAGQIRGPLQFAFARSTERILPLDAAITRCAITKSSDFLKKQTEFGRKPWLSYAAYEQHGFYNPLLGMQTVVSRDDLARFWEALSGMFPNSASASKGEMATRDLLVFVHESKWGKAPSHKLFELVSVQKNEKTGPILKIEGISEEKLKNLGITVHHPLKDIWGDL
jgi:CRISPR-associated protein Csd2